MSNRLKIYFRADGNAEMGLGHVFRSLALVEILNNLFECNFIIQNPLPILKKQILKYSDSITELPETTNLQQEANNLLSIIKKGETIVLDGYHFKTEYQIILKNHGIKIVCIDDIYANHFVADAIINHAPGLLPSIYSAEQNTQFYLGLDYSLLRKPFLEAALRDRKIRKIKNLFICLGGSDFNNITITILQDLKDNQSNLKAVHIVLGGANLYKEAVKKFVASITSFDIYLYENLSASEMVGVMEKADLAIVPASSILYEVTAVKMAVISGYYVDNQINVYHGFKDLELIYGVGNLNHFSDYGNLIQNLTVEASNQMIAKQKYYNSGQSEQNLINLFKSLVMVTYRKAKIEDLMTYYNWANDKTVRANAISKAEILLENHKKWFTEKIMAKNSTLYIFFLNHHPIGQVRFDIADRIATISYSVDKQFRGQKLGFEILKISLNAFIEERNIETINSICGIVKIKNIASNKIFQKLGFVSENQKVIEKEVYNVFTLNVQNDNNNC